MSSGWRSSAPRLGAPFARARRRVRWRVHLHDEVGYWTGWLRDHGGEYPDDYRRRLDPRSSLDERLIVDAIERPARCIRILDVGAGPLTSLGKVLDGRQLEIVPVDPLAERYDALLAAEGITPPVRTLQCRGEDLVERFGPESFDVVYARNSLDHSADPLLVLKNMLTVTRRGGSVASRHFRNEADKGGYGGLHQWNFDVRDRTLVLWSRGREIDVREHLGSEAALHARLEGNWVICVLEKPSRAPRC